MNNQNKLIKSIIVVFLFTLVVSCATTPKEDQRITNLENQLNDLMSQSDLANRGGEELSRAQKALNQIKNQFRDMDEEDLDYAIYATDRLIELARYTAQARWFDDKRAMLVDEQSRLVLESRTLEADLATQRAQAANASAEAAKLQREQAMKEAEAARLMRDEALKAAAFAEQQKQLALTARNEAEKLKAEAEAAATSAMSEAEKAKLMAAAEAAKAEAAIAEASAAKAAMQQLESELTELKAKQTDRGLVITLGDVLFEFNQSDLKSGATRNLTPLVSALNKDPEQTVIIEGHTDNIGSETYNLDLSQRRAESVKQYLIDQGIDNSRVSTKGLGFEFPVATNNTNEGRQQNRRVEIILPQESAQQ